MGGTVNTTVSYGVVNELVGATASGVACATVFTVVSVSEPAVCKTVDN